MHAMPVDLENARAGMTLRADVISAKGQLLLKAGATLSGKHLQLLRANGVQQVEIDSGDRGDTAATGAADTDIAAVERQLDERFRVCDDRHPAIRELRRLCQARLIGPPAKGEGDD